MLSSPAWANAIRGPERVRRARRDGRPCDGATPVQERMIIAALLIGAIAPVLVPTVAWTWVCSDRNICRRRVRREEAADARLMARRRPPS